MQPFARWTMHMAGSQARCTPRYSPTGMVIYSFRSAGKKALRVGFKILLERIASWYKGTVSTLGRWKLRCDHRSVADSTAKSLFAVSMCATKHIHSRINMPTQQRNVVIVSYAARILCTCSILECSLHYNGP